MTYNFHFSVPQSKKKKAYWEANVTSILLLSICLHMFYSTIRDETLFSLFGYRVFLTVTMYFLNGICKAGNRTMKEEFFPFSI